MASAKTALLLNSGEPSRKPHRRRSKEERRQIVEETLVPGASVARVARAHEVNANQVFHWRKLYGQGLLGVAPKQGGLLPVRIADAAPRETGEEIQTVRQVSHETPEARAAAGAIHLDLAKARIRIEGHADRESLRVILECLLG